MTCFAFTRSLSVFVDQGSQPGPLIRISWLASDNPGAEPKNTNIDRLMRTIMMMLNLLAFTPQALEGAADVPWLVACVVAWVVA